MQVSHEAMSSLQGPVYRRREPERGKLYEVIRDNLQTLYAAIEDGFASPLPAFVRDEFERYLDCVADSAPPPVDERQSKKALLWATHFGPV